MDTPPNSRPSPTFRPPVGTVDRFYLRLIDMQSRRIFGRFARHLLRLRGIDFKCRPGEGMILRHSGNVVIHGMTRIGKGVMIHQGVTVGRSDVWREPSDTFQGFVIEDYVILGANAVVTSREGLLTVGEGTVVGANSVLTTNTGPWEIWAGVPAVKIGMRRD